MDEGARLINNMFQVKSISLQFREDIIMVIVRSIGLVFFAWKCVFFFVFFSLKSEFRLWLPNTTFNNISVISWSVSLICCGLVMVFIINHRPAASHRQTLSHKVVSSTPRHGRASNSQL